jgi:microcystin-dependent protein
LLGFGTWVAFGAGKVPIGLDAGDADFDTIGETGGTKDAIIPTHNHTAVTTSTDAGHQHGNLRYQRLEGGTGGANFWVDVINTNTSVGYAQITSATTVANAGESATGKNLQPYVVVYMWKRTA